MNIRLLAGAFLGWSLGANDAANVFGTAVSSQMVRWRTATILIAIFCLAGALMQGGAGLETYAGLTGQDLDSAFCVAMAAAITTTIMTVFRIPVSTSQAVVGAILGVGLAHKNVNFDGLEKVVLCWVGTPLGAGLLGMILYPLLARTVRAMNLHFLTYDRLMRNLLILAGIYGAYALGANNVANVTGVFYKAGVFGPPGFTAKLLALLMGGLSIGFGALTYSKGVMMTVGKKIIPLDAFSAFVVILCEALTIHFYSMVGVPVSTSQAVVGAVLGIGLLKGMRTVSGWTLARIVTGWVLTPAMGLALAAGLLHLVA